MTTAPGEARVPVAAAVVIHAGRVLVQTRPEGKAYAGFWEFPGGKIEPGEDASACAVRECREELGLDVLPGEALHEVSWEYPGTAVHVTFVQCEPVRGSDACSVQPREGQQLCWADAEALASLTFLPANADVLRLLIERLLRGAGSVNDY